MSTTYFLLKGLSGEAWKGNKLMFSDLADYVRGDVRGFTRALFGESLQQTPPASPALSPENDVVLAEN
jgi:hypothetical protein